MAKSSNKDRSKALIKLYRYWTRFDSWTVSECASLAAGLDPRNPLNANPPLVAIEDSHYAEILSLVERSTDLNMVDHSDRIEKAEFIRWVVKRIGELLPKEFVDDYARASPGQMIKGPQARQDALKLHVKNRWPDRIVTISVAELHRQFLDENPLIKPVKIGAFEKDLSVLGIHFTKGRPESS